MIISITVKHNRDVISDRLLHITILLEDIERGIFEEKYTKIESMRERENCTLKGE